LEVYYVKYPEGKRSLLCHPTIIYRAEADGVNRVIEVSINPFTRKLYYHVCKDNLEPLSSEECYKDFDRTSPHESMRKAFERGMDNYSNVIEDAIKVWAKEHGMNGSATLGQIMCNIDVSKIKLK
jgi:hypothetical protein